MRNEILAMIKDIHPFDALESEHQSNIIRWIESGADLFRIQKPAIPPKHLVSYFVVIDPQQQRILLVDHIKAQLWLPAGGHVEINEHPRATVIREASEELSFHTDFLLENPLFVTETVTVGLTAGHKDVSLWFVIRGNSNEEVKFDPSEFKSVQWFALSEVLEMDIATLDPHMHRFIRKWQQTQS